MSLVKNHIRHFKIVHKGPIFSFSYVSCKMRWSDCHITWRGQDTGSLSDSQKCFVIEKVREYGRRLPVKAKVVQIEEENEGEVDAIGLAKVNGSLHFVSITYGFLIVMDLRSVKNDIVAQLWQDNRYMNLD